MYIYIYLCYFFLIKIKKFKHRKYLVIKKIMPQVDYITFFPTLFYFIIFFIINFFIFEKYIKQLIDFNKFLIIFNEINNFKIRVFFFELNILENIIITETEFFEITE